MSWRRALAPLALGEFRIYWAGRTVSLLGNALAPVVVAFAVLELGGAAGDVGLVLAARGVPLVVLLLLGGVVADRFSRQRVLVVACLLSGLVQALAAGLLIGGGASIGLLAATEAVHGAVSAFTMPAAAGMVPLLAPREQWQQANALISAGKTGAMMAGPALGGVVVATAGAGWALAVDAATFLMAAAFYMRLRLRPVARTPSSSTLAELRAGWGEFTSRAWLWQTMLALTVLNTVYAGAWMTLGPVTAEDSIGPTGWGLALTAMAVGMLLGTLLLLRRSWSYPLRAAISGVLLFAIPVATLAFSPGLAVLMVAALIGGIGFNLFGITWETVVQEHVPTESLSRVVSYDMLAVAVAIPLGHATAGAAAEIFDPQPVILVATAVYLAVGIMTLCSPAVWRLRTPNQPLKQISP